MSEPTRTIGQLAQLACAWEVRARKVGNVCPGREFPDLTVDDFLKSAAAIAPVLDRAAEQPLGLTILRAVEATRQVVTTNTNLGMVLLLAPLASAPLDQPLRPTLSRLLAETTIEDARNAYQAIRLANPGGLGKAPAQDVAAEPTAPLRNVMDLARKRDRIAEQYVTDFAFVIDLVAHDLVRRLSACQCLERAIVETHLLLLRHSGDDLIRRKMGARAGNYQMQAFRVLQKGLDHKEGRKLFLDLDKFLRADNHARNPGTTADLVAAGLFVALREKKFDPALPFIWDQHPFEIGV
jgi:triphosphoribosyl-dephospho-CoA synthase